MKNIIEDKSQKIIIIYDGICVLCNRYVQWIIKRDKAQKFEFYSIDEYLKLDNPVPNILFTLKYIDSVVVIENFKIHTKSRALFVILQNIHSWAKILLIFQFLSTKSLNKMYDYIARNRYKWYGKIDCCKTKQQNIDKEIEKSQQCLLEIRKKAITSQIPVPTSKLNEPNLHTVSH